MIDAGSMFAAGVGVVIVVWFLVAVRRSAAHFRSMEAALEQERAHREEAARMTTAAIHYLLTRRTELAQGVSEGLEPQGVPPVFAEFIGQLPEEGEG